MKNIRKYRVQAVIIKNNKLLLIEHKYKNKTFWALPGGGVEKNETLENALIREIKEETFLEIKIIKELFRENISNIPPFLYENKITYLTKIINGTLKLGCEPETIGLASEFKIIDIKWFDFDKIPKFSSKITEIEIKKIKKILFKI